MTSSNLPSRGIASSGSPVVTSVSWLIPLVSPVLSGSSALTAGSGSRSGVFPLGLFLLLLHQLIRITPEEGIDHNMPVLGAGERSTTQVEDFTSEEVEDQGDGLLTLVVARDGEIDVLERRVGVAESDDRDVRVRGLLDSLGIGTRIGDDDQSRLSKLLGDVVCKRTRSPATRMSDGSNVVGELKDRTGTIRTLGDDHDVFRVFDRDNNTCSDHDLFPCLSQIQQVDSVLGATVDVALHAMVDVQCTEMGSAPVGFGKDM